MNLNPELRCRASVKHLPEGSYHVRTLYRSYIPLIPLLLLPIYLYSYALYRTSQFWRPPFRCKSQPPLNAGEDAAKNFFQFADSWGLQSDLKLPAIFCLGVQSLGFRGLGVRVQSLGFRGLGFRGLGSRGLGLGGLRYMTTQEKIMEHEMEAGLYAYYAM